MTPLMALLALVAPSNPAALPSGKESPVLAGAAPFLLWNSFVLMSVLTELLFSQTGMVPEVLCPVWGTPSCIPSSAVRGQPERHWKLFPSASALFCGSSQALDRPGLL